MSNKTIPILETEQITRRFGGLTAVNSVSFAVQEQEIFGLIGPNGAGKTTLFNLITGLIPPTEGKIRCQGELLNHCKPHQIAQKGIARTFQNLRLFANLSVLENVEIAHHLHYRANLIKTIFNLPPTAKEEQKTEQQARELLSLLGLADKAEQLARNLSYGDQRRLEIARALALQPQVLLLDEPAAGMNPSEKGALTDLIRQIRHTFQLTIILIEHHVPLVMGLCDRIAVLDFGHLIALGIPEIVKNDPAVIEAYLGDEERD
ncbi:MAG: ABC transporter ATP-binding protein [Microcystaceae cyanobacterium]